MNVTFFNVFCIPICTSKKIHFDKTGCTPETRLQIENDDTAVQKQVASNREMILRIKEDIKQIQLKEQKLQDFLSGTGVIKYWNSFMS